MTPILLNPETEQRIRDHAAACYPKESCGLIVQNPTGLVYLSCRNSHQDPNNHFQMMAEDYVAAEDVGTIVAIVHSHPDAAPYPSLADTLYCNRSGLQSFIVACDKGAADGHIHLVLPDTRPVPYIGRQFEHGLQDCYQLIKDYYERELGIDLPAYKRWDGWWEDGSRSLYEENFEAAGFVDVPLADIKEGDMIVMQLRSPVPNHAAIYVGEGYILHHLYGRLSSKELYRDVWQNITRYVKRHRSKL